MSYELFGLIVTEMNSSNSVYIHTSQLVMSK